MVVETAQLHGPSGHRDDRCYISQRSRHDGYHGSFTDNDAREHELARISELVFSIGTNLSRLWNNRSTSAPDTSLEMGSSEDAGATGSVDRRGKVAELGTETGCPPEALSPSVDKAGVRFRRKHSN